LATLANLKEGGAPQRRAAGRLSAGAAALVMLALVPSAEAQDAAQLAKSLTDGVRCEPANALADLSANVARVQQTAAEMVTAVLTTVAGDQAVCEPVRVAAQTLVADAGTRAAAETKEPDQARALVEATLAEADRRSAAMKFEVGPPPLNLSRGRRGGS